MDCCVDTCQFPVHGWSDREHYQSRSAARSFTILYQSPSMDNHPIVIECTRPLSSSLTLSPEAAEGRKRHLMFGLCSNGRRTWETAAHFTNVALSGHYKDSLFDSRSMRKTMPNDAVAGEVYSLILCCRHEWNELLPMTKKGGKSQKRCLPQTIYHIVFKPCYLYQV
jgi:hypothetical protein